MVNMVIEAMDTKMAPTTIRSGDLFFVDICQYAPPLFFEVDDKYKRIIKTYYATMEYKNEYAIFLTGFTPNFEICYLNRNLNIHHFL